MSVVNRNQVKVTLYRDGEDSFWKLIRQEFLQGPPSQRRRRLKYLAMLALRVNSGWTVEQIGDLFGHPKGHIPRCLERIKQEIRDAFDVEY